MSISSYNRLLLTSFKMSMFDFVGRRTGCDVSVDDIMVADRDRDYSGKKQLLKSR